MTHHKQPDRFERMLAKNTMDADDWRACSIPAQRVLDLLRDEHQANQAELDRVMERAVRFAEVAKIACKVIYDKRPIPELDAFLTSHEVRAWRERQCDHQWGTDGQHSNEFCKKCFVNKARQKEHS